MVSPLLLLVLHLTPICARPAIDLWKLPVNEPAHSAELGPPGAVNADREPSHLKYEVLGIVGAYLIWILATVLLIFFVGHRLRRSNIAVTNGSVKLKMFKLQGKPGPKDLRPSPKNMRDPASSKVSSPESPEKKSSIRSWGRTAKEAKATESVKSASHIDSPSNSVAYETNLHDRAEIQNDQKVPTQPHVASTVPPSPLDDEYENEHDSDPAEQEHLYQSNKLSHPLAPTPQEDQLDDDLEFSQSRKYRPKKSKPLAIISEFGTLASALVSPRRPKTLSDRELKTSKATKSADYDDDDEYADSMPLSPRLYHPGPAPLTPSQRKAQQLIAPVLPEDEQDQRRPKSKERKIPPSLALRKEVSNNASNGSKALPFRQTYGEQPLASAGPTRTTFVERPDQMNSGPRTGAIPQTPYSAYMPYTPMTPITPGRLVGKAEMKRNKKEAKLKVLSEDDLVVEEDKGY